jgi:hypothetical protein
MGEIRFTDQHHCVTLVDSLSLGHVPYKGYGSGRYKSSGQRQQCHNVTNHSNGRSTIRTSAPDIARFHTESGDVSRRLETQMGTVADDVVREVLDRLRLGTASGNQYITPVDLDVPGSRLVLHGPHGRSTTSSVACRHVSRVGLSGRRCSPSRPPSRLCQPSGGTAGQPDSTSSGP